MQVPMVARLVSLFLAFYYGEMGGREEVERRRRLSHREKPREEGEGEGGEAEEGEEYGLSGLLWDVGTSVGSALLPIYWEDEEGGGVLETGPPVPPSSLLGLYVREATLTLKLAASVKQKGFYGGGKQSFLPHCVARVQGVYTEVSSQGLGWGVVQGGVSQLSLTPLTHPAFPVEASPTFLLAGCEGETFLQGSLFQAEQGSEAPSLPVELAGQSPPDNWESHAEQFTETRLLERTAALALDYVYSLELPGEEEASVSLSDLEHSDLPERALARVVVGPASLLLTEGALARVHSLAGLVRQYEYTPYCGAREEPGPEGLELPSQEEVARLEGNSPVRVVRLTVLHPGLTLQRGGSRLDMGLRCLDLVHQVPMYPLRNVRAACLLHPPSRTILQVGRVRLYQPSMI